MTEEENQGNVIPGIKAADLVQYIASQLVTEPDTIFIENEQIDDNKIKLTIESHPDDVGRLIGKKGYVIRSIRRLARAAGAQEDVIVDVEVAG
jgi:predicted RNA-binding protein YlqC (UPF0109 family)